MIRCFDILFSFIGLFLGFPILFLIFILGVFDTGFPFFFQKRVGRYKSPFTLVKFRSMSKDTKSVASHLVPIESITPLGSFLRKTKLDELPQLWNVFKGDMSLVGPRPNLYNQLKVLQERETLGVYKVRPGITGLAQINNIDMSTPELLATADAKMISTFSVAKYFKYIFLTIAGKGQGDRVRY